MAGVFEECGRFIVMKYIMKKNRTRENSVLYGIGHGGIEIIAVVLPSMISYLVIAVEFSSGDITTALSTLGITEENAAAALTSVQTVAAFGYGMMAACRHRTSYADGSFPRTLPEERGAAMGG